MVLYAECLAEDDRVNQETNSGLPEIPDSLDDLDWGDLDQIPDQYRQ